MGQPRPLLATLSDQADAFWQERVAAASATAAESSAGLPPPQDVGSGRDPESWRTAALQERLDKLVEVRFSLWGWGGGRGGVYPTWA